MLYRYFLNILKEGKIFYLDLIIIDGYDMLDKVIFYILIIKFFFLYIFFIVWYLGMMNRFKYLNKI